MKKAITLLFYILFILNIKGQYQFSFSYYTSDDGLSQNSITAMMKDSKGYMWFGTREGLNKFDGYNFTNYNAKSDPDKIVLNTRILLIEEDHWGYIWIKTYDDLVYRLNPSTQEYTGLMLQDGSCLKEKINDFFMLPSGDIWLTSYEKGGYKITTHPITNELMIELFDMSHPDTWSDNIINYVFEDRYKNSWILTNHGLVKHDSIGKSLLYYEDMPFYAAEESDKRILFGSKGRIISMEKRSENFKLIEIPEQIVIKKIARHAGENYILITENHGFFTYDAVRESLKHYNRLLYPEMKTDDILDVYIDKSDEIWFSIKSDGVLHFNTQDNKNTLSFIPTLLNDGQLTNPNYLIFEDEKDVLWIQPYYGTFSWYDRTSGRLVPFHSAYNEDVNRLFSYGVNHVLSDDRGVLWISTNRGNGVLKATFLPDYFNHHLLQGNTVYSISNEIRTIFEDNKKRLWVSSKDGSLYVFDQNKKMIGSLDTDGAIRIGGKKELYVYNILQDQSGDIWLATKRHGLFRLKEKKRPNTFSMENFLHQSNDLYSPNHNDFYSIVQDKNGRIWAGSYGGGLHVLVKENGVMRFIHANNDLKNYPIANCSKIRQLLVDSNNQIWVATTEGFIVFDANLKDLEQLKFNYYNHNDNHPSGLKANDVLCIYESADSTVWLGTFGGGLSKLTSQLGEENFPSFEIFDRSAGLPNNVIYTILDDKQGNLWLTTDNSIVKFNKTIHEIEVYGKGIEFETVEFSEASACILTSGEICVGSKSGFYTFRPEAVKRRMIHAPLVFTRLLLFNKEVEIGTPGSVLQAHIDNSSALIFNQKQNVFTIEFATLDMRAPEKIEYAYKLEGFDTEWNYVQNKHFATYTSLAPGDYIFQVRSTDSEGIWLNNVRTIKLKMLPTFWQSGLAKLLYVLVALIIFGLALMIFLTIYKLKNNVQVEKQMTDMKLRFYTDISHELRTPLSLISLPIDNLLQEDLDTAIKEQLSFMRRNLDRVLGLINQILDFRKLQSNKMRLIVEEVSFGEFVKNSANNFMETALTKDIDFKIIDETNHIKVWLDPERFESVIYNLLSNAFKFTPEGKSITVKCWIKQNKAVLSVIDEGIGIEQEKINFIFDRFFSVSALSNIARKSTGIGLDLIKKIADLHHATIQVESQIGQGSTFELSFKLGLEHYNADETDIIIPDVNKSMLSSELDKQHTIQENLDPNNQAQRDNDIPLILIVEDNEDLRFFLKNSLKNNYRVEEAANGIEGWKKIEHLNPDLIISDILMPEMDGLQLLDTIKLDRRTSHIPVILLTAVTDMESKIAGLKIGADDYITKPFSAAFLQARIENLMNQRSLLQQYYRYQMLSPKPDFSLPPLEISSQEEIFMKKMMKLMEENLDNYDLNIDYLASEIGMSRTVFYNKLKSLTGFSPVEFVREIRFQHAGEYVKNTQYSISEISYRVGFNDPRYFSRSFKQHFGMTPSEYRQQHALNK